MAEPTPGRPGGQGGPRSATAATFQVSDSSLRGLHQTWRTLIKDVQDFNKELQGLSRGAKTVDQIVAKLNGLGFHAGSAGAGSAGGSGGRPGGRPAGMPPVPVPLGSTIPVGAPAGYSPPQPGQGGAPNPPAGGGGGGGGGTPPLAGGSSPWGHRAKVGAAVVGGAALAVSSFYGSRMQEISDSDLFYNQQAQNTGYGYRESEKADVRTQMFGRPGGQGPQGGLTGYQNVGDALQGASTLLGATGGRVGGRGWAQLREAGSLSSLTPDAGLAGSAAAVSSLYDPTTSARAMSIGAGPTIGAGGQLQSPQMIYQRILQTVYRGQKPTAEDITQGMQPGAPLYVTLTRGLGLTPDAIQQFQRYAIAQANMGGDARQTQQAMDLASKYAAGGDLTKSQKALVGRAGLLDNIRSGQNAQGAAQARQTVEAGREGEDALESGFHRLADVTDRVTDAFERLNGASGGKSGGILGTTALAAGPVSGALGAMGGIGGAIFAAQGIRSMFGGGRNRGGGGGGAGGIGGGSGDPGGQTYRVWVVNCCPGGGSGGGGGGIDAPDVGTGGSGGGGGLLGRLGRGVARVGRGVRATAVPAAAVAGLATMGYAGVQGIRGAQSDEGRHLRDLIKEEQKERGEDGALSGANAWLKSSFHSGLGSVPLIGGRIRGALGTDDLLEKDRKKKEKDEAALEEKRHQAQELNRRFISTNDPTYGTGDFHYARGGKVPGNHDRDDVPIFATPGELVVPKPVVGKHGGPTALMRKLGFQGRGNEGHYAGGGEVTGDTNGLNAEFLKRLQAFSAAVGEPFKVGSGYRSLAEQQVLYDRWMRKVPGQAKAAKPGSSNHNFGLAVDGPRWRGRHPERFGLRYPMDFEPWHIEPENAKAMRGGAAAAQPAVGTPTGPDGTTGAAATPGANIATAPSVFADERSAMAAFMGNANAPVIAGGTTKTSGIEAAPPKSSGVDSTSPTTAVPASNPNSNVTLGQQKAAARGWTGVEWDSLYKLWEKESGWRTEAANGGSSARGIPQAMMSLVFGKDWKTDKAAQSFMSDPNKQIDWGLNYIQQRYQKPSKAWAHSQKLNWYEKGSWETDDEVARLHKGEMVVPAQAAKKLRQAAADARRVSTTPDAPQQVVSQRPNVVQVSISMPVTLAGQATQKDAEKLVGMVADRLEENQVLARLGTGGG